MDNELLDDIQTSTGAGKMLQASLRKRLLATGVDAFIFMGIYMIFNSLIIELAGGLFAFTYYLELLFFVAIIVYIPFVESSRKQGTLGKQFLKIKIVDQEGRRIKFGHAVGRNFVKLALFPILLITLVSKNKDKKDGGILDTYVIETTLSLDE